jgi:glycine/D-amino acid oxidase-like deaminating enzyme
MPSLWLHLGPEFRGGGELPGRAVDVAVVGAGVAGISTALHLAALGADVAVLDAGVVGGRASGRNDGQLLLGLGEHYNRIVGQFGSERARWLWDFIRRNHEHTRSAIERHGIDCSLVQGGGLRLAETAHEADELREAAALLRGQGIAHELLSPADLALRFPAGRGYFGAMYLPGEAIVQPLAMVRGFADAAVAAGAAVVERAAVESVGGQPGEFTLTLAGGRSLRAAAVVFCTAALARGLDDSGFLQRIVFPFRGQVIATEPLPDAVLAGLPRCAMSSNFCYEYFRVHERRLLLGGMRWSVKGEELGIVDDDAHNEDVSANLRAYAARHFEVGEELQFPRVWTGIMAGTPDGLPLLGGIPGRPGVFTLSAFNGYGLSFAFLAGKCLAETIVAGRCDDPAMPLFAPRRFV